MLAGDEYWTPETLTPKLTFPGKSTETLGVPYANESLAQWHRLNREAILAWQPAELPAAPALLEASASATGVFAAVRDAGPVRFAVVANGRFRRGAFADKHGYVDEEYHDEGVAQETDLLVKAPAGAVVYDVTHSRRLQPGDGPAVGERRKLRVALAGAGGAIYAFHPRPIAAVRASTGTDKPVTPGTVVPVTLTVVDDRGQAVGPTALQVTVRDPQGQVQDVSGVYPAREGMARVWFGVPVGAPAGIWQVEAQDLTSGEKVSGKVRVAER